MSGPTFGQRVVYGLALRELELRLRVASTCFRAASAFGRVGSFVSGTAYVKLERPADVGTDQIELSYRPTRLVRGLRIENETSMEVVRVVRVAGSVVTIDRPLAQAYPKGAKVKVLV